MGEEGSESQHGTETRMRWTAEWIDDHDASEREAVLIILGNEEIAPGLRHGG
jgi:hypothetical protein